MLNQPDDTFMARGYEGDRHAECFEHATRQRASHPGGLAVRV